MINRVAVAVVTISSILCGAASASTITTESHPALPGPSILVEPLTDLPLHLVAPRLDGQVARRALDAVVCAEEDGVVVNKLLVVDMSMPANKKRLWAFDRSDGSFRLILEARVAHGSGSDPDGDGRAQRFSNIEGSNMTSLGLYRIAERYQGKNGWSRKLDGLFAGFNSRARERSVVMHPSSYVGPGHVGRSHGCPAVNQSTMDALEAAGLSNAILWIDGPDKTLAHEVQACASKHKQRLMALAATRVLGSFSDVVDTDSVLPWAAVLVPHIARACRPAAEPAERYACGVDSASTGPTVMA